MKGRFFDGQITIAEYLESVGAKEINSNMLFSGQVVYLVEKCDISKYEVYGFFNIDDIDSVVLIAREGAEEPFVNIAVEELDGILFETKEAAEEQVLKVLEECDCILASDMKIESFKAFTSKSRNGKLLTAFYAQLNNGYIYMKDYHSDGHLLKCSVKEAERILRESVETYDFESHESFVAPRLKNMYRTDPDIAGDWQYAERGSLLFAI